MDIWVLQILLCISSVWYLNDLSIGNTDYFDFSSAEIIAAKISLHSNTGSWRMQLKSMSI